MKKIYLLLCLNILCILSMAQSVVKLTGNIGPYKIEMELNSNDDKEYPVTGKYRYAGKKAWLGLQGYARGGILYLQEIFEGKETGEFFMSWDGEGKYSGRWVGNSSWHETVLNEQSGSAHSLEPAVNESYVVSDAITGSYVSESWFVNDQWFSDDNPQLEIGFNGGAVVIEEIHPDSIWFNFTLICGPTYHYAVASGVAWKTSPGVYEYKHLEYDPEEPCSLTFHFTVKQVEITEQSSNYSCGFGARAYADGLFDKVNNVAVKDSVDLGVDDVLPK